VTSQSLLGGFGRRAGGRGRSSRPRLVHFIASDAHDCERRPPRLDLAFAHVAEQWENRSHSGSLSESGAAWQANRCRARASGTPRRTGRKWYNSGSNTGLRPASPIRAKGDAYCPQETGFGIHREPVANGKVMRDLQEADPAGFCAASIPILSGLQGTNIQAATIW